MGTNVLLVDDNAARSDERRDDLVAAGVEVISAFEEHQAANALKSHPVDVVCIDSQFVMNCGWGVGALIDGLNPTVPVVLVVDDSHLPSHFEKYVDIMIDRAEFDLTGPRLMQQLNRGQIPFFQRWFTDWVNRASESRSGEAIPKC